MYGGSRYFSRSSEGILEHSICLVVKGDRRPFSLSREGDTKPYDSSDDPAWSCPDTCQWKRY